MAPSMHAFSKDHYITYIKKVSAISEILNAALNFAPCANPF